MAVGSDMAEDPVGPDGLTNEQRRRRRSRSVALAIAIGALVILMLAVTLAKGPDIISQPL